MERRTQTRCVPVPRRRTGFERRDRLCRTLRKPVETGGVLAGVVDEFAKRFFVGRPSLLLAVSAILKSFTISPPACRAYRLRASSCTSSKSLLVPVRDWGHEHGGYVLACVGYDDVGTSPISWTAKNASISASAPSKRVLPVRPSRFLWSDARAIQRCRRLKAVELLAAQSHRGVEGPSP